MGTVLRRLSTSMRTIQTAQGWVKQNILLLSVFLVFSAAYLYHLDAWLMDDDEGTDFYEVWQLQQGRRPGIDFVAEQQPLFLLLGKAVVSVAGRSPLALRLVSVVQVLLGALALAVSVGRLWNGRVAASTLGLVLACGLVYEQARLFRPDPMMFAWELGGLAVVLLAIQFRRRWLWVLAGAAFGIAVLFKPFGVFPLVGLAVYFLTQLGRRTPWRKVIADGLGMGAGFLLVAAGVSALLYARLGFYYAEPLAQHLSLGQANTPVDQLAKVLVGYGLLWLGNTVFVFTVPLWLMNRPDAEMQPTSLPFLLVQLVTPAIFIGIKRKIYLRYFMYILPYVAILLAWQLDLAMTRIGQQSMRARRFYPLAVCLVLGFAVITTLPGFGATLVGRDRGTLALSRYVAENTEPGDLVLSDYAGINFFANRTSIYEASIIAGGRIEGQVITGRLLIERIKKAPVEMVLIHTEGGSPPPHHLVQLVDYDAFRDYVGAQFVLLTIFDRSGQQIEVYKKR